MFQMCGVFAEFERSMIAERVKTGLARAKAQGKKLGPPTRKNLDPKVERRSYRHARRGAQHEHHRPRAWPWHEDD